MAAIGLIILIHDWQVFDVWLEPIGDKNMILFDLSGLLLVKPGVQTIL